MARRAVDRLSRVSDSLIELSTRLQRTAEMLRAGQLEPEATLTAIEDCARLASEASAHVDQRARAALEPLPDLPGQLPLPAS
jgi:hypothetical protein